MAKRRAGRLDRRRACASALLALVLACGLVPVPAAGAEAAEAAATADDAAALELVEGTYVEGEVLIVYADEALSADDEELADAGVVDQDVIAEADGDDGEGAVAVAQLNEDTTVEEAIEALAGDESVAYVQPNYTYELLTTTTSDPYLVSDSTASGNQYYLFSSSFTEAWDYVRTEWSATVAVLDTGCNLEHEDLQGTVDAELAYDVTADEPLASTGVDNNGDAMGHGTMVCGIIAAYANNSTGIAGASYNANVLPVKVFDDDEECTSSSIVAAYEYLDGLIDSGELTDLCAINMSIGYYSSGNTPDDVAMRTVIAAMLEEHDVITVCAGGNGDGSTAYTQACYPADYDECVSVTALDTDGTDASFSDYNRYKDISAYGCKIYTTSYTGGYTRASGTSVASPQVAAAIALLKTANPDLTSEEVVDILQDTADTVRGQHASSGSAGALDAEEAVLAALATADDDGSGDDDADDDDQDAAVSFTDVQDPDVYWYEAIYALVDAGYLTGMTDTYFGAASTLTRAQMVTVMWRIVCADEAADYDQDAARNTTAFKDVGRGGAYYTAAVNWAYSEGVVKGVSSTSFDPTGTVTFEQFCTILARTLAGGDDALEALFTDEEAACALSAFADGDEVSAWADKAMAFCVTTEVDGQAIVVGNTDGTLDPSSGIPRGRMAVLVYRSLSLFEALSGDS